MTDGSYGGSSEFYDGFQDIKLIQLLNSTTSTTDKGYYGEVRFIKCL